MALNIRKTINATFTALLEFIEPLSSAETNIVNSKYYIGQKENDNKKHYYPALSSDTDTISYNGKIYSYNSGLKTIFFKAPGGTIYRLPNVESSSYDIPAGTYTPSAFRNMLANYVSLNGSRNCANAFTVKVNNQTLNISSGTAIHYRQNGSSPGELVVAGFGSYAYDARSIAGSFTDYKTYVLYRGNVGNYPIVLNNYANYSITITTGINFA